MTDKNDNLDNLQPEDSFERLLDLARGGDREAIGRLMQRWRDYLLLIANDEIAPELKAKMGASDIVQQSMLAAGTKIEQFRGESEQEFRGWLRQILKNDVYDLRRKYQRSRQRNVDRELSVDDSANQTQLFDSQVTPGTNAITQEHANILLSAMKELSDGYRQIIRLRNWEEHSFEAIGKKLGCSADAARKQWYRAIIKLQEILHHKYPDVQLSSIIKPR